MGRTNLAILCAWGACLLALPALADSPVYIRGAAEAGGGVPNYAQASFAGDNDCGPTAAAMLLGFYDGNRWPTIIADSEPYYTVNSGPPAGLVELDGRLKYRLPYSGTFGTWDFESIAAVSNIWAAITSSAWDMDPGAAAWSGDDDQFVDKSTIRDETCAERPIMFNVRLTRWKMEWNTGERVGVDYHWLTTVGYWDYTDSDFYVGMRSGWRSGGDSFLWYEWSVWDDLYIVKVFPGGSPQCSYGPQFLYTHPSGASCLWRPANSRVGFAQKDFPTYTGWEVRGYHRRDSKTGRLLWGAANGVACLSNLTMTNDLDGSARYYNQGAGWKVLGYQKLNDNSGRMLWRYENSNQWVLLGDEPSVKAIIWVLDANEQRASTSEFVNPGYEPVSYQSLENGFGQLLWKGPNNEAQVWIVQEAWPLWIKWSQASLGTSWFDSSLFLWRTSSGKNTLFRSVDFLGYTWETTYNSWFGYESCTTYGGNASDLYWDVKAYSEK